jgi:uncharacterized protein (DUF4415 family)
MKNQGVCFLLDTAFAGPMTSAQIADLAGIEIELAAAGKKEGQGAPVQSLPAGAMHQPLFRPTKTSTTVRIDSDVLLWLKGKGSGYQTRINAILRETMVREGRKG